LIRHSKPPHFTYKKEVTQVVRKIAIDNSHEINPMQKKRRAQRKWPFTILEGSCDSKLGLIPSPGSDLSAPVSPLPPATHTVSIISFGAP
jgi:hypothetical protein